MSNNYKYVPWGFKLNLMYASIPPRSYRNLHNFNEFNAPRIDIGMLTGALYEQSLYGFCSTTPKIGHTFYEARKADVESRVTALFIEVGAIGSAEEIAFPNGSSFVPPDRDVPRTAEPGQLQVLFVYYGAADSVGDAQCLGYPFLRVITASLEPASGDAYRWTYHEYQFGRGDPEHMCRRFLAGPMFIAYFGDAYASLEFDDQITTHPLFDEHTTYFKVDESCKAPFDALIARETVSQPNEYGQCVVSWDGEPAHRSILASQSYYDWDDDLQSAQTDARITRRLAQLEARVAELERNQK